ncbi:MAG: type II toxin-antitoxin system VapC family toxin [Thermodesulfovibrionales bacterium]
MVLVDTSVWVEHFRTGNVGLANLLNEGDVASHLFIAGELACGNLSNRPEILSLFRALPLVTHAEHDEVLQFIENYKLMGKGLGYVDMHLITSAVLTKVPIWTLDKKLKDVSSRLDLVYQQTTGR